MSFGKRGELELGENVHWVKCDYCNKTSGLYSSIELAQITEDFTLVPVKIGGFDWQNDICSDCTQNYQIGEN